jgi:hypothetical protein
LKRKGDKMNEKPLVTKKIYGAISVILVTFFVFLSLLCTFCKRDQPHERKEGVKAKKEEIIQQPPSLPRPPISSITYVGILGSGFAYDMDRLLRSFKEQTKFIKPEDISPELIKDIPLLIIPSGPLLYEKKKSSILTRSLEEYVKRGGTIFVFSKRYGQEFSIIPGGIGGYGSFEDQSAYQDSCYIDTWHHVLAGHTKATLSLHVDGYFTKYPNNTVTFLRRTSNGQPTLLLYPYGSGYVITTSAHTDTAYGNGEASEDERRLIRDIVAWAQYPIPLAERKPGESITIDLPIKNRHDSFTAVGVDIVFYDPDGNFLKRVGKQPLHLAPGESTLFPVSYEIPQNARAGIYQIKYELYTIDEILWPSEEKPDGDLVRTDIYFQGSVKDFSGRFAVRYPLNTEYQVSEAAFSVQSDTENYVSGFKATFTMNIWNNTDRKKTIRAEYDKQSQFISVAPNSLESITYSKVVNSTGRFWAYFYDHSGNKIGQSFRGYRVDEYSVIPTLSADKAVYHKGETITLKISLKNETLAHLQTEIRISIQDTGNKKIFEESKKVALPPDPDVGEEMSIGFTLPATAVEGAYKANVEVWYGAKLVSSTFNNLKIVQ